MFSKPLPKLPEPTLPRLSSAVSQHEPSSTERVKSKKESVECRAFQKCFAVLADGISDPGWLAVQLYSRELIGADLRKEAQKQAIAEREKTHKLLSAVEDQIVASPATKLREFLDVLQNEPSLQHLATMLETTHRELVSMSTPTSSSSLPRSVDPHPCPPFPPATKRPRTSNFLPFQHPLEHTIHFQKDHQTVPGCSQAHLCTTKLLFAVDTYASYLKSVYTREKLPIYDKWPQLKAKKYINLALIGRGDITKHEADEFMTATIHGNIDDINKSKRAMYIGEIAELPDGSQPKCILVEGAPGVGKSTFAWKLCRKWGKGKLLQQYQLVVLLRLRDKSVRTAKSIFDLFRYHQHHIQHAAVEKIIDMGGKGVFLLFEGYDELPEELRTENSVFLDIITGTKLPEATVLITSRPWASEFLHRKCRRHISQHVEILGFTKANIQSYLESTTDNDPSLPEGLNKYISCYPHIGSLMYIPLYCAFVVEVYRNSRKNETLVVPKTMTELYTSLIRDLLQCHLLEHTVHGKKKRWRVCTFSDLPQDIFQQLCELGRIAYKGILHGQQVIFSDLPEEFETLGLMQCAPELYVGEGATVSYNFLHLTVQEYLAAFHLSQQQVEEQVWHFQKYCDGKNGQSGAKSFHMVLRFLSGIRKFSGYPSEVLKALYMEESDVLNTIEEPDVDSDSDLQSSFGFESNCALNDSYRVTFDTLHWLFEAQDNDVIAKLLGQSDIELHEPNLRYEETPFDYFVLGYCVSHSNCTWKITFGHTCSIGDEEVEMFAQGAVEEKTYCRGRISVIESSGNDITFKGVEYLLNIPRHLIEDLEMLVLNNLDPDFPKDTLYVALARLIQNVPHLKCLDLSHTMIADEISPISSLIESLTGHNSLEQLLLHDTAIDVNECQALSELLSSMNLKKLDISANQLCSEAVEVIIRGLHHNITLKELYMRDTHFSPQNSILLASMLRTNQTLVELILGHYEHRNDSSYEECDMNSDGACQLAHALCTNNTLQKLHLCVNPFGVKAAAAFSDMLIKNKSIKELKLHAVGKNGSQKLIDSLENNTAVENLFNEKVYHSFYDRSAVDNWAEVEHTHISLYMH